MRKNKAIIQSLLFVILLLGCNSNRTEFNTLYDADSIEDNVSINIRIEEDNFILIIQESENQYGPAVFYKSAQFDNSVYTMYFRDASIENIIRELLSVKTDSLLRFFNSSSLPMMNLTFQINVIESDENYIFEKNEELLGILMDIFPIKMEEKKERHLVYNFSLHGVSGLPSLFENIDTEKYITAAGLVYPDTDELFRGNVNEDKAVYYATTTDVLKNLKSKGTFVFENNTGLGTGVLALPVKSYNYSYDDYLSYIMEHCREYRIKVDQIMQAVDSNYITFGEL